MKVPRNATLDLMLTFNQNARYKIQGSTWLKDKATLSLTYEVISRPLENNAAPIFAILTLL